MAAPLMHLADVVEIRDAADSRPATATATAITTGAPRFELHRRLIDALYTRAAGLLMGFRYGARMRVGRHSSSEFMVLRVRPWWSRAGLKVIVHFGIPPRRGAK